MNDVWIATQVTLPVAELICYWVLIIALAMLAATGWALYKSANDRASKGFPFCPLVNKPDNTTVVSEPSTQGGRVSNGAAKSDN